MAKKVIANKLRISFFALILIATAVISLFVYLLTNSSIESKVEDYSKDIIGQVGLNTKQKLRKAENISGDMTQAESLRNNMEEMYSKEELYDRYMLQNDIAKEVTYAKNSNKEIYDIAIIDKDKKIIGGEMRFGASSVDNTVIEELVELSKINDGKEQWINYSTKADTEKVYLVYLNTIKGPKTNNYMGTLAIIFNTDILGEVYDNLNLGSNSAVFSLNSEGRVITSKGKAVVSEDYIKEEFIKALSTEGSKGSSGAFDYKDSVGNKLVVFSKVAGIDMYNIAVMTVENYKAGTAKVIVVITVTGLLCLVLAYFLVSAITKSITRPLAAFTKNIDTAGEGNLAATSKDVYKDEIALIQNNFAEMLRKLVTLIQGTKDVIEKVYQSTNTINQLSKHSNEACDGIACTMDEISKGAENQKDIVRQGTDSMESLSLAINDMTSDMSQVSTVIKDSTKVIEELMLKVGILNTKTAETTDSSQVIIKEIIELSEEMKVVKEVTNLIMSISEQTNILSLNAAIEAARAGQAGRGFSVVASEVRRLAEESKQASIEINDIIENISSRTRITVEDANTLAEILREQSSAVKDMNEVFKTVHSGMEELHNTIGTMQKSTKDIEDIKNTAINTMGEVATVSETTTESAKQVFSRTQEQIGGIRNVAELTTELIASAETLNRSVKKFKLDGE
jgi:methyl-accepting chemotaxis protein